MFSRLVYCSVWGMEIVTVIGSTQTPNLPRCGRAKATLRCNMLCDVATRRAVFQTGTDTAGLALCPWPRSLPASSYLDVAAEHHSLRPRSALELQLDKTMSRVVEGTTLRMGSIDHTRSVPLESAHDGPPPTWACMTERFADGICDCECGAYDPDCRTPSQVHFTAAPHSLPRHNAIMPIVRLAGERLLTGLVMHNRREMLDLAGHFGANYGAQKHGSFSKCHIGSA